MEIRLSENLTNGVKDIEPLLFEIASYARHLDRDLRTRHLYVEARCSRNANNYAGHAWPWKWTLHRRLDRFITHENGKITMSIGIESTEADIATLFGHELRHIGQFHRGQKKHGFFTIFPLTRAECEDDAYAFEDRVLDGLGL